MQLEQTYIAVLLILEEDMDLFIISSNVYIDENRG